MTDGWQFWPPNKAASATAASAVDDGYYDYEEMRSDVMMIRVRTEGCVSRAFLSVVVLD